MEAIKLLRGEADERFSAVADALEARVSEARAELPELQSRAKKRRREWKENLDLKLITHCAAFVDNCVPKLERDEHMDVDEAFETFVKIPHATPESLRIWANDVASASKELAKAKNVVKTKGAAMEDAVLGLDDVVVAIENRSDEIISKHKPVVDADGNVMQPRRDAHRDALDRYALIARAIGNEKE